MPIFNNTITLDGITDVTIPSPFGRVWSWDAGWIGYMSYFDGDSTNTHNLTYNLSGSNWQINTFRFAGNSQMNVTLTDTNGLSGRDIRFLQLADDTTLNLISTRVHYIEGFDGTYDINLGATNTDLVRLGSDLAKSISVADGGRISSVQTDRGSTDITLMGNAGISQLKMDFGTHTLTTGTGNIQTFSSYNSDNTLDIGTGGIGAIRIAGGGHTQTITSAGWIGAVVIYDDNDTSMTLTNNAGAIRVSGGHHVLDSGAGHIESYRSEGGTNVLNFGTGGAGAVVFSGLAGVQHVTSNGWIAGLYSFDDRVVATLNNGAGTVRLSNADDVVNLTGGADLIRTGGGRDTVLVDSGGVLTIATGDGIDTVRLTGGSGASLIHLGTGDDRLYLSQVSDDSGWRVYGGSGTDFLSLQPFGVNAITFNMGDTGFQNIAAPGGSLTLPGLGRLQASSIENLTTGGGSDQIWGSDANNRIITNAGADTVDGGSGDDTLLGGNGADILRGGDGNDRLDGENQNDQLDGGAGDDVLVGGAGNDLFIFTEGLGQDTVLDFTTTDGAADRLMLDENIWGGGKTEAQVVADYGSVSGAGHAVLNFGAAGRIVLVDYGTLAGLDTHIDLF